MNHESNAEILEQLGRRYDAGFVTGCSEKISSGQTPASAHTARERNRRPDLRGESG